MLEGQWSPAYPEIIEFESMEQAEAWQNSQEYEPMKWIRQSAVSCNGILVDGVPVE